MYMIVCLLTSHRAEPVGGDGIRAGPGADGGETRAGVHGGQREDPQDE